MIGKDIDPGRIFSILKELIRIDSVTGREQRISEHIFSFLKGLGLQPEIIAMTEDRPNIVCTIGSEGPLIAFHGHMDTVDVLDHDIWSKDPYDPWEDEKFIYGRGSFDMKCGLAAMMHVAEILAGDGSLACRVMLMFVCDEEKSAEYGSRFIIDRMDRGILQRPDFMVSGEESWGMIRNADRGICSAVVTFRGKSSHTSHARKDAINAITNAARGVLVLDKDIPLTHPCVGRPMLSVNGICTLNETNKVPGACEVIVDIRPIPDMTEEDVLRLVRERLDPLREEFGADSPVPFEYDVRIHNFREGSITPADHPMLVRFADSVARVSGSAPGFFVQDCGVTDNRFFRMAGVPCIVFGPEGYADHGPDERVDKASLLLMARAYLGFCRSF